MKTTKYSNFCLSRFRSLFSWYNKKPLELKNQVFVKANIQRSYEEYYSTALMSSLIGLFIGIIFTIFLYFLIPLTIILIFLPLIVTFSIIGFYYYYPTYCIKKRKLNIDLFLPYAINFISSMAVAGISPAEIFETLANVNVYGEVQTEAKRITKEIKVMGIDNITALKHAIEASPSSKFKAFLQGIIGTLQSGSELHTYLKNISKKFMEDDLADRKKDLDLLAVIAEVFVLAVIAFPIFLVIILTVMGFFGGSMSVSLSLLLLFSFIILPVIYTVFYILIKSTSIEEITKVHLDKTITLKEFYEENKIPLLILLMSLIIILSFYSFFYIYSSLNEINLDIYFNWDFALVALLILIAPLGFYNFLKMKEKKEMQQRLPDFLTEVSDSLLTGMNIFDSIKAAQKGHYGKLDPEIKKMKTQLSWNVSMKNVLNDFATRMKSAIVQRIIMAIEKGLIMGGNTPQIFKAASKEVDQVNQIEYQRKSIMSVYALVIIVCFFVFLAIVLILKGTVYESFLELQIGQASQIKGALQLNTFDPMLLNYTLYSFTFIESLGAGVLAGFMTDGKLSSGIRYSFILGIITIFVFKILF
jgi:flagellar protein FlaJ